MPYGKYTLVVTTPSSKQKHTKIIEVKSKDQLLRERQPQPILADKSPEWANR